MYPSCTHRELGELACSIEEGKYWKAGPGMAFSVALTRARRLRGRDWVAKVTGLGQVTVPGPLKPYCRRGRVVLVSSSAPSRAVLVLGWPAFLWVMRKGKVHPLVEGALAGKLAGYVGIPRLKEYLKCDDEEGLAGPSGIGPETPGSL